MQNINPADLREASIDAIAAAIGAPVAAPHPLASNVDQPLRRLARACAALARPIGDNERESAILGRGMNTGDFSRSLAAGSQPLARQLFDVSAGHRVFRSTIELRDFHPVTLTDVDVDAKLVEVGEGNEALAGFALEDVGATVGLRSFAKIIGFTRAVVLNDQTDFVRRVMNKLGTGAATTEAAMVAAALEENPLLSDGATVFDAAHGNVVTSATFGDDELGQAFSLLRKQKPIGGNQANLTARHLIVADDLEYRAKKLIYTAGFADQVTVSGLAGLPAGRWFVAADPSIAPTIAVLKLQGSSHSVAVEMLKASAGYDGVLQIVRADLGAAMVGRIGIVRGGA